MDIGKVDRITATNLHVLNRLLYCKAFDCVENQKLWNTMAEMGQPEHMVQVIRSLYANQEANVRTEYGDTESFSIGKCVRQGCVLSPYLLNLYSEYIMTQEHLEELDIGLRMGGRKIHNLRYADDTTLLSESKEEYIQLVTKVKEKSAQAGLYLNLKKTKVMYTEEIEEFELNGENVNLYGMLSSSEPKLKTRVPVKEPF